MKTATHVGIETGRDSSQVAFMMGKIKVPDISLMT